MKKELSKTGPKLPNIKKLSKEEREYLYTYADVIKKFFNNLEKDMLHDAMSGTKFKRYKVVRGVSRRKWKDGGDLDERFENAGVDYEDTVTSKHISPAQVEKLLGKEETQKFFGDLIVKPEGKLKLVPIGHTGEEVHITNESLELLTDMSEDD